MNENTITLIVGDSHPMSSLDPSIIKHSINISLDSENYFFTYYKLKRFLRNNSQIKNVIIGFSPQNISKISAENFLFNESIEKQSYERYFNLIDINGKNKIKSFRKNFVEAILKYDVGIPIKTYKDKKLRNILQGKRIKKSDYEFIGDFYAGKKSKVNKENIEKKIKGYYFNDNISYPGKSDLNIEYLNKIIKMCLKYSVKVYLYRSPVHITYLQMIPNEALIDYENFKNELVGKYENIEFLDYSQLQIKPECYGDGDHVNICGAKVVSQIVYEKVSRDTKKK